MYSQGLETLKRQGRHGNEDAGVSADEGTSIPIMAGHGYCQLGLISMCS